MKRVHAHTLLLVAVTLLVADRIWQGFHANAQAQPEPVAVTCDINRDGQRDISDVISLLNWLFSDGPEPPLCMAQDTGDHEQRIRALEAKLAEITATADGNIGIGTPIPEAKVEISGPEIPGAPWTAEVLRWYSSSYPSQYGSLYSDLSGQSGGIAFGIAGERQLYIAQNTGYVGVGTTTPAAKLDVRGTTLISGDLGVGTIPQGNPQATLDVRGSAIIVGSVGVGTLSPQATVDVQGDIRCQTISTDGSGSFQFVEIRGADLAEKFDITGNAEAGMVVGADPENPGKLRVIAQPYDESVVGVVSGAGGIRPGVVLHQPGVADGDHLVAMVGRAYVLADASYGEIKPGTPLTSSQTSGHAMKATDKQRAIGAVLGTALSGLKEGKGLVLVAIQRR